MPPNEEAGCTKCSFRGEVLAELKGIREIVEAKLDGIKSEVGNGFQGIRINIDKIERNQTKQWQNIAEHGQKIGINSQKLSGFKWVIGILITLQLSTFASVIWVALKK
jgi:hypothetical protein